MSGPSIRIDLWCWPLPATTAASDLAVLTADERARADRFATPELRARYVRARAEMRRILGRYLAVEPATLRLAQEPGGKPVLEDPGLFFNLSHTGALAALAVSRDAPMGVDIEQLRDVDDGVAERFFAPGERAALRRLPRGLAWRRGFFTAWTRKEAYLKAIGTGIVADLGRFEVSLAPESGARLLSVADDPWAPRRWRLFHFEPTETVLGAVAVEAAGRSVRLSPVQWARSEADVDADPHRAPTETPAPRGAP